MNFLANIYSHSKYQTYLIHPVQEKSGKMTSSKVSWEKVFVNNKRY